MSDTRRGRVPPSVRTVEVKSFTNGTIGLMTTISFAPACTAMSRLVVETIPPSITSRSSTRTGADTTRRDPAGAQRRDERARRRAHVDVELRDRAVERQQVQRAQRAYLVHAAREPAPAQHERRLVRARPPASVDRRLPAHPARGHPGPPLGCRPLALGRRFQLDNLAHGSFILRARDPEVLFPGRARARACEQARAPGGRAPASEAGSSGVLARL